MEDADNVTHIKIIYYILKIVWFNDVNCKDYKAPVMVGWMCTEHQQNDNDRG